MNEAKKSLPQGWANAKLNDISLLRYEKVEPSGLKKKAYISLEHIESESNRIIDHGYSEDVKSLKSIFYAGDVLYGKLRPYLNKVCQPNFDGVCSTDILVFKQSPALDNRLLLQLLSRRETVKYANAHVKGINLPRISAYQLGELNIDLPPLNEQKRIVARIEELQVRSRHAKEALEAIPDQLEQFRRSILAAAVSGRLTEDWRETSTDENTNTPMRHQEGSDSEGIQFPEYWKTYSVGDVLTLIDGDRGPNYPKQDDYKDSGHCLFLSTKNVRKYGFLFDEVVFITEEKHKILRNGTLERGDVIITTRGTLGNVAVYDEKVPYNVVRINSGMLIVRKKDIDLLSDFIRIYIASPYFIEQLNEKRTGSAQPQIPAGILKSFTINVPPLAEQHEIVKRVEELFKIADQVEERYFQVKKHLNTLDQSILSKAFRGELVPQDPNDAPASILLERIRQEKVREAIQPKAKAIRNSHNGDPPQRMMKIGKGFCSLR